MDEALTSPAAFDAIRWLASQEVPLVLVSQRPAADVLAIQHVHGVRHPFVCDGGAVLYLPAGYFPELTRIGTASEGWNIVEFKSPDAGHAIRLLVSLFRLCSEETVVVGLSTSREDGTLLREVDVPFVVTGVSGWSEAILGSLPE